MDRGTHPGVAAHGGGRRRDRLQPGGRQRGWQLYSISRWSREDARRLRTHLEEEFISRENRQIYWDDVALFCHRSEYRLGVRRMDRDDVVEIDELEELVRLDGSYAAFLKGAEGNEE